MTPTPVPKLLMLYVSIVPPHCRNSPDRILTLDGHIGYYGPRQRNANHYVPIPYAHRQTTNRLRQETSLESWAGLGV